jgi:hypothetical protein
LTSAGRPISERRLHLLAVNFFPNAGEKSGNLRAFAQSATITRQNIFDHCR